MFLIAVVFITYKVTRVMIIHSSFQHLGTPLSLSNKRLVHTDLRILLKKIVNLLNELKIKWFITSGTLLGYMRNNKFILWDDDIDIRSFSQDHDKLISYINSLEYKNNYRYSSKFNLYFNQSTQGKDWFQISNKSDFLIHADIVNQSFKSSLWKNENFISKIEIGRLEDINVNVPLEVDAIKVLTNSYGNNWFVPQ